MDPLKALHEWKKGGRGETMMSTFEYKSSHDKIFIEGFRMAELYYEEAKIAESNTSKNPGRQSDEGVEGGRIETTENGKN